MNSHNIPDLNPVDNDTLAGALQFAYMKMMQQNMNSMLPAQVVAYERASNRVQVQLLITMVTTDGSQVPRSQLASLPVAIFGGGGFSLSFDLVAGDFGWVKACDRDISLFLQSYAQSPPNTARMFSFSDGMFFPDAMKTYTASSEAAGSCVLANKDGTIKIVLTSTGITLTAPTVTVAGALVASDGITLSGAGGNPINVTGNMNLTGNIAVTGNITATGSITPHV